MFFSNTSRMSLPSKRFLSNNSSIFDGSLKILGSLCSVLWLNCVKQAYDPYFSETQVSCYLFVPQPCCCSIDECVAVGYTSKQEIAEPSPQPAQRLADLSCSHSWDTPGQWQMKGLARHCGGKQESGVGIDFQAALSELRTGFSHLCPKLQKLSAQPVASLQLQEIQLWALTYCRDSVISVTEEVSFWQVGLTWWHLCEALEMTSAVV